MTESAHANRIGLNDGPFPCHLIVSFLAASLLYHDKPLPSLYNRPSTLTIGENMGIRSYNRDAWNKEVEGGDNRWTQPVTSEVIAKARQGEFSVLLTENIPVPQRWFPVFKGADVLCLASGGGQQGPVFAALCANVAIFDNSPSQLKQDQLVAEREALSLKTVEADAADLSTFADESFDLVFNPCSTVFMQDARIVWRGSFFVFWQGGDFFLRFVKPGDFFFFFF